MAQDRASEGSMQESFLLITQVLHYDKILSVCVSMCLSLAKGTMVSMLI